MAEEQVLKKEEKLEYKSSFWKNKRGTLALTKSDLHFVSKKGKEVFRVALADIVSVNIAKGVGNGVDFLFVIYKDAGKERRAQFVHRNVIAGLFTGGFARMAENHFKSWEQFINDTRFGKSSGNSTAIEDLERLASLRDKGVLTAEEFSAKKKQLLGI